MTVYARDNGPYIGLYATPAGKVLTGAEIKAYFLTLKEVEE